MIFRHPDLRSQTALRPGRLAVAVVCFGLSLTYLNHAMASLTCSSLFVRSQEEQTRSKLVERNGIIGFSHNIASTRNVLSILRSGALLSRARATGNNIKLDIGFIATARTDLVYFSEIYDTEFDLIPFSNKPLGRYYVPKSREPWSEPAVFRVSTKVIDQKNFSHASRSWLPHGEFHPRISFLPDNLAGLFVEGGRPIKVRGEFVFQDEVPLDLMSTEVWVAPHVRAPLLKALIETNPNVNWEMIVRAKAGEPIYDPRELTDAEYLYKARANEALQDLWVIDRVAAIRVARMVVASPDPEWAVRSVSRALIEMWEKESPDPTER